MHTIFQMNTPFLSEQDIQNLLHLIQPKIEVGKKLIELTKSVEVKTFHEQLVGLADKLQQILLSK
jgi:hypothetical protein